MTGFINTMKRLLAGILTAGLIVTALPGEAPASELNTAGSIDAGTGSEISDPGTVMLDASGKSADESGVEAVYSDTAANSNEVANRDDVTEKAAEDNDAETPSGSGDVLEPLDGSETGLTQDTDEPETDETEAAESAESEATEASDPDSLAGLGYKIVVIQKTYNDTNEFTPGNKMLLTGENEYTVTGDFSFTVRCNTNDNFYKPYVTLSPFVLDGSKSEDGAKGTYTYNVTAEMLKNATDAENADDDGYHKVLFIGHGRYGCKYLESSLFKSVSFVSRGKLMEYTNGPIEIERGGQFKYYDGDDVYITGLSGGNPNTDFVEVSIGNNQKLYGDLFPNETENGELFCLGSLASSFNLEIKAKPLKAGAITARGTDYSDNDVDGCKITCQVSPVDGGKNVICRENESVRVELKPSSPYFIESYYINSMIAKIRAGNGTQEEIALNYDESKKVYYCVVPFEKLAKGAVSDTPSVEISVCVKKGDASIPVKIVDDKGKTVPGATVTWQNNVDALKPLVNGKILCPVNNDLCVDALPAAGYRIASIKASFKGGKTAEGTNDYGTHGRLNLFQTMGYDLKDCTGITVTVSRNEGTDVAISGELLERKEANNTTDKKTELDASELKAKYGLSVKGLDSSNKASDKELVLTFKLDAIKESLEGIECVIGRPDDPGMAAYGFKPDLEGTEKKSGNTVTYTYRLKAEDVIRAWDQGWDIDIKITTRKEMRTIWMDRRAFFHSYTKIELNKDGTKKSGDEINRYNFYSRFFPRNDTSSKQLFVVTGISNATEYKDLYDNYEIDKVMQGDTVLKPMQDSYKSSPEVKKPDMKTMVYYESLPVMEDDIITVTLKPKAVTEDKTFDVTVNGSNSTFMPADKSIFFDEDNGKWTVSKDASAVAFTVTTNDTAIVPYAELWTIDSENGEPIAKIDDLTGTYKYDKDHSKRILTVNTLATKLSGRAVLIRETAAPDKVISVSYDPKHVTKPCFSIEGAEDFIEGTYLNMSHDNTVRIPAKAFGKVTVTAEALDHYKLTGIIVDGVPVKGSEKTGKAAFMVEGDDITVSLEDEGIPAMYMKDLQIQNKGKISLTSEYISSEKGANLVVRKGTKEDPAIEITEVSTKPSVPGFAKRTSDRKGVIIDATMASDGYPNVAVTVKYENNGKKEEQTVNYVVEQKPKVTLSGAVVDKKTGDVSIRQTRGTTAIYPMSVNNGANIGRVLGATPVISGSYESLQDMSVEVDKDKKALVVKTFKPVDDPDYGIINETVETFTVDLFEDYLSHPKHVGGPFTVTVLPDTTAFAAPDVKVINATDVNMKISLACPRNISNYANLFYKITATAKTEIPQYSNMRSPTIFIPASEGSCSLILSKNNPGEGAKVTYDIAAKIIRIKDIAGYDAGNQTLKDTAITIKEGAEKELKNQSTKDPAYETKFSLNKKTTTFIAGEKDILLATGKFSKDTTFCSIGKAWITGPDGTVCPGFETGVEGSRLVITEDGQVIKILDSSSANLVPGGKYTLAATPELPGGVLSTYSVPATLALTVKPAVTGIELSAPSTSIYRPAGKAATMKLAVSVRGYSDPDDPAAKEIKPANSSLSYTVTSTDIENVEKYITCKNGTITVSKDLVLSGNSSNDRFTVTAVAQDLGTDGVTSDPLEFTIVSSCMEPKVMDIGDVRGETGKAVPEGELSDAYNGKELKVYVSGSNRPITCEELKNMLITVSPATGLAFDDDYRAVVTKPGTYTVKVTCNDGGKKSLSARFTVKSDEFKDVPYSVNVYRIPAAGLVSLIPDPETKLPWLDNSVNTDFLYLLGVEVNAETENNCVANTGYKVEAKNAKILKSGDLKKATGMNPPENLCYVMPNEGADTVTITVKSTDKKIKYDESYVIRLDDSVKKLIPEKSYTLYEQDMVMREYKFSLSGETQLAAGNIACMRFVPAEDAFTKADAYYNAKKLCSFLNGYNEDEGKPVFEVTRDYRNGLTDLTLAGVMTVPIGTYPVYATLYEGRYETVNEGEDDEHTEFIPVKALSTTQKVTFKLIKVPVPKAALNTEVEIKNQRGEYGIIEFKSFSDATKAVSAEALSINNNGTVNRFRNYFQAEVMPDGSAVKLTRRADMPPVPDQYTEIKTVNGEQVKTISGWIRYSIGAVNGNPLYSVKKTEMVTVIIK
ncbi:MAG: hypothetical protein K5886_02875 [Lachnospiraceae bacterium]|nr:hypothetical protein [Lachnospiraceae bacterium]